MLYSFVLGEWSQCNVTCGEGVRTRTVECKIYFTSSKRTEILPDDQCYSEKPTSIETCSLDPCPSFSHSSSSSSSSSSFTKRHGNFASRELTQKNSLSLTSKAAGSSGKTIYLQETLEKNRLQDEDEDEDDDEDDVVERKGKELRQQEVEEQQQQQQQAQAQQQLQLKATNSEGKNSQLQFEWRTNGFTPCSASCLGGKKNLYKDLLHVVLWYLLLSLLLLLLLMLMSKVSYFGRFFPSLTGIQESIIECIRTFDQQVVVPYLCDISSKPDSVTKTCNDIPCPPRSVEIVVYICFYCVFLCGSFTQVTLFIALSSHRLTLASFIFFICFRWKFSEWSNCSTNCGSGHQHRTVECIHEVTRGHENTIIVPDSKCTLPIPKTKRFCNVTNCTPKWLTEPWSTCSKKCGGIGYMIRSVICVNEYNGKNVPIDNNLCKNNLKPSTKKSCNNGPCSGSNLPYDSQSKYSISHKNGNNYSYNNNNNKNHNHNHNNKLIVSSNDDIYVQQEKLKRVTLKVGGKAVLFEGTTVKIRCPRKKSHNKVEWSKDRRRLNYTNHIQLTPKYALRIKNLHQSDAGIYTCTVGSSQGSIKIALHSNEILNKKLSYSPQLPSLDLFNNNNNNNISTVLQQHHGKSVTSFSNVDSIPTEVSNEVSIRSFDFSTSETRYVSDERQEIGEFDQTYNISISGNVHPSSSSSSTDYTSIFYYGIEKVVQGFARSSASSRTSLTLPHFFQLLLTPITCTLENVFSTLFLLTTNTSSYIEFNTFYYSNHFTCANFFT